MQSFQSLVLFSFWVLLLQLNAVAQPPGDRESSLENPETVDIWLLAGQSNMQGIGKLSNIPDDYPKAISNTFFWNGRQKQFVPLVVGETQTSVRPSDFGPEIGFAREIATDLRENYLVKYDASGMALHHGWNGNRWAGGDPTPKRRNFYPGKNSKDANRGTLYISMVKRFQTAIQSVEAKGKTPVVRGLLWMQGEQDSKHADSASSYAESLAQLRERLAADLGLDELPLIFGQVLPFEPAANRFICRDIIRSQMAAADSESGHTSSIQLARMVSTDECELLPDTVHYSAAGQLRLGRAMGIAAKALTSEKE